MQAGLIRRQWGDSGGPSGGLPQTLPEPAAIGRTALLLDISQLMEEGYPLPDAGQYSRAFQGFVPTKDMYKPVSSGREWSQGQFIAGKMVTRLVLSHCFGYTWLLRLTRSSFPLLNVLP